MEPLVRFLNHAMKLKTLKRAGWQRCGVEPCESVADHTFGVALLALTLPKLADAGVNRDHCIALALAHDLAESIVGDITPHDNVDAAVKHQREQAAMRELADTLRDDELFSLWQEFEEAKSPEAQLVRDLDVIEMALQAKTYERGGGLSRGDADKFMKSARSRVTTSLGRRLLNELTK
jgi:putative hydrolase of HD superfamily